MYIWKVTTGQTLEVSWGTSYVKAATIQEAIEKVLAAEVKKENYVVITSAELTEIREIVGVKF